MSSNFRAIYILYIPRGTYQLTFATRSCESATRRMGLVTRGSGLRVGYLERSSHAAGRLAAIFGPGGFLSYFRVEQSNETRVKVLSPSPPSIHSTQVPIYLTGRPWSLAWGGLLGEVYAETCGTTTCGTVLDLPDPGGVGGKKC